MRLEQLVQSLSREVTSADILHGLWAAGVPTITVNGLAKRTRLVATKEGEALLGISRSANRPRRKLTNGTLSNRQTAGIYPSVEIYL